MLCPYPVYIKVPDNKIYPYSHYAVPCGKCFFCRQRLANGWFVRIKSDIGTSPAYFVTLTYNDENLPFDDNGVPCVSRDDFTKFMKRFRKFVGKSNIKYFGCSEYCPTTYRPHYHFIVWNLPDYKSQNAVEAILTATWNKGFYLVQPVIDERIRYVVKYQLEETAVPKEMRPLFRMMSKNIGKPYLEKQSTRYFHEGNIEHYYYRDGEYKYALPRYFSEKLYTKVERDYFASKNEEKFRKQSENPRLYAESVRIAEKKIREKFSKTRKKNVI